MPPDKDPSNRRLGRRRRLGTESDKNEITPLGARSRLEHAYANRPDGWATRRARRNDLRGKSDDGD